ncbi:HNH endonuclease [Pseudoclavibacter chungangensis]|uniref:HNH endonuclease n=1 Tax=Pseudoclavibacter chungangensis TaxID=587635 RepID=A0A7J5C3U0_9MICO|nr:HNH endonuclease family protein [Pseudoclavibacter chungangensis]KAB1662450.1 HNH endonuclease [Pseudoclavibacter chungangensis]NYJ68481.1 hypothetical protein [Pseudoclavibacter chungangensis]
MRVPTRAVRRLVTVAVAAGVAVTAPFALVACGTVASGGDAERTSLAQQLTEQGDAPAPTAAANAEIAANALAVLESIEVAPRTEWDGPFDRARSFGDGWGDPDGNGCDARNDALARELTDVALLGDGCRVERGSFHDPYSGETVEFVRGPGTSDDVQIDHVVALYNSWRTGAQDLSFDERVALANDPLNLQPTLDWVNDEKMSQDASQWLPPSESYHCVYVARQIAVKASYELWVTAAERDAMTRVLHDCGG